MSGEHETPLLQAPLLRTAISDVRPDQIRLRGYRIEDLMRSRSFAEGVWVAWMGDLPDAATARLVDAMLVSCIDHGPMAPSIQSTRTAATARVPLSSAVAAGLIPISSVHGGAVSGAMQVVADIVAEYRRSQANADVPCTVTEELTTAAAAVIRDYKSRGQRLQGFGHPLHRTDPRTVELFALADRVGKAGCHVAAARAAEAVMADARPLTLNIDGAMGALLLDLQVPMELANAFFILSRTVGLVAHYTEEVAREKLLRLPTASVIYDGPAPRDVPTRP